MNKLQANLPQDFHTIDLPMFRTSETILKLIVKDKVSFLN